MPDGWPDAGRAETAERWFAAGTGVAEVGGVPRVSIERAAEVPWLALLSGLVHGRDPASGAAEAAVAALRFVPERLRAACYDILEHTLGEVVRLIRENQMHFENYEFKGPTALRKMAEARLQEARELLLAVADRHGRVRDELRARVDGCSDGERMRTLVVELANAGDRDAVEALIQTLPAG